jgi:2-methylaconitate cis-trans-isomerase PrpF
MAWSIRSRIPENGICTVRIWQKNIEKTIIAHVPITNSQVQKQVILN